MPDPDPQTFDARDLDRVVSPTSQIRRGLTQIDTMTAGMENVTAGFLIEAPRPALIECGPALTIESVIGGLRSLGMDPDDLAYLVISHIHLDHGGGAGDVAAAFPNATVVCHDIGVRHMVDPERLNASSRRVYGPLFDSVYGACTPIDATRIRGISGHETLDLGGGQQLDLWPAPGHAKHHIGVFDADHGDLFVGDSVGVKMPGMTAIRPATPPPDFDHVLALRTLDHYIDLAPDAVHLAHYGRVDPPADALEEAKHRLNLWVDTAEQAWSENADLDHVAETLGHRFASEQTDDISEQDRRNVELFSGIRSNAMGLTRYFQMKEEGRVAT